MAQLTTRVRVYPQKGDPTDQVVEERYLNEEGLWELLWELGSWRGGEGNRTTVSVLGFHRLWSRKAKNKTLPTLQGDVLVIVCLEVGEEAEVYVDYDLLMPTRQLDNFVEKTSAVVGVITALEDAKDQMWCLPWGIDHCNVLPQTSTLQALTGPQDGLRPPLQYGRRSMVAAVRAAPPPQYGRRRVSASRQRFLGDAARPLPGDGSSGTSPVRRQSVRTTFGLDATVGGYVGAIWDSSARALRHLAKAIGHPCASSREALASPTRGTCVATLIIFLA
eukprot:jgi/Chrzof1/4370/Cz14g10200.t1